MRLIYCFFGFYRNGSDFQVNESIRRNDNVFVCTPSIKNEDLPDVPVETEQLKHKFGPKAKLFLFAYNKSVLINKAQALNIPRFNEFYQQSYRIFSFFNSFRNVLQCYAMSKTYKPDNIIVLARCDIGLKVNENEILKYIQQYDVILGKHSGPHGTDDKWFVFKFRNINLFLSLFDSYAIYLKEFYAEPKVTTLATTRPEDVFVHHFQRNRKSFVFTEETVVKYDFQHVCSDFCGHHGAETKT